MSPQTKVCRICGDEATGFNYGELSCESCKVFFHRNWNKLERFVCRNRKNACQITQNNRRHCSHCRLKKCLKNGMKRYQIDNKSIIRQNTTKSSTEDRLQRKIELILEISILKRPEKANIVQYIKAATDPTSLGPVDLTRYELERLVEVRTALQCFPEEMSARVARVMCNYADGVLVVPNQVFYFTKCIDYAHRLPAFNCLKRETQLALLRRTALDMLQIRASYLFDLQLCGHFMISNSDGTEAVFVSEEIGSGSSRLDCVESNWKFAKGLTREMGKDTTLLELLSALVLFRNYSEAPQGEFLRYQYLLYCRLLLRYLEQKHKNRAVARRRFLALLKFLEQLEETRENNRQIIEEFGVENLPPLVVELHNLKK